MKHIIFFVSCIFISINIYSSVPSLDQLSKTQVDEISKEFAGNFVHTTVSPASTLGNIFGLELGFMGGQTTATNIDKISKSISASSSVPNLYNAGLIGIVSIPFGLSAEANVIPKITKGGLGFMNGSVAGKFTLTSLIPKATFDMAIRGFYGTGELSYQTVVNNSSTGNVDVNTKATWKNKSYGYNVMISKKFLYIFEPYFAYGGISTNTDIGLTASSTVSIFNFSNASSYNSKNTGSELIYGMNINLFILKLGAEYAKIMGATRYAAKLSLYF